VPGGWDSKSTADQRVLWADEVNFRIELILIRVAQNEQFASAAILAAKTLAEFQAEGTFTEIDLKGGVQRQIGVLKNASKVLGQIIMDLEDQNFEIVNNATSVVVTAIENLRSRVYDSVGNGVKIPGGSPV
jgi:hypothetical protein